MAEKIKMTSAEYFKLPETMQKTELIKSFVYRFSNPTIQHQRLAGNFLIRIDKLTPNGEVLPVPSDVIFDENNILQPDILGG